MHITLPPLIASLLFALLGLTLGSFGNVVIGRVPAGESLLGRSHCPHCKRILSPAELVPVLSWIFLRARCRGCHSRIAYQYPAVELIMLALFLLAAWQTSFALIPGLSLALALWTMLVIAIIDQRTQLIPDALTLTLALAAILVQWSSNGFINVTGALVGLGLFGGLWLISNGRWIGSGDVLLSAALGLLLGSWQLATIGILASSMLGGAVAAFLLVTGRATRGSTLPFGPLLVTGAAMALFLGQSGIEWMIYSFVS